MTRSALVQSGAIALLVASVSTPLLLAEIDRARTRRTMGDMRTIATGCESYGSRFDHFPLASSMEELRLLLEPTHVRKLPLVDGWGRSYLFTSTGVGYVVASRGSDGAWERPDAVGRAAGGGFAAPTFRELAEDALRRLTSPKEKDAT